MPVVTPPQVEAAQNQLLAAIQQVDKKQIDPLTTPWAEIESSVIKLLGGAFQMERPEHQAVALGLSAMFGARLVRDHQAFWFPNREAMEGAVLGFPEALVMLSPFGAVVEALRGARLAKLDERARELASSIGQVKFSPSAAMGTPRLSPLDYQRLFDPGFVQFIVLDPVKADQAWNSSPDTLLREVRQALGRVGSALPEDGKQQFEGQFVMALKRLDPAVPLLKQIERAPRVAELVGHLFATAGATGSAAEELWQDVVLPLLHIGAPESFPPLDEEEIAAAKQGLPALLIYLDTVPYRTPAPEEGLLGAFAADELGLPHEGFEKVGSMRLVKLKRDRLQPLVDGFDPVKTRDAVMRFSQMLEAKTGQKSPEHREAAELLDASLALLTDLKKALQSKGELCLRRLTEAEASSDAALTVVRGALQGPKIILV